MCRVQMVNNFILAAHGLYQFVKENNILVQKGHFFLSLREAPPSNMHIVTIFSGIYQYLDDMII